MASAARWQSALRLPMPPVDALLDEVAGVEGIGLDQRQPVDKGLVGRFLGMKRHAGKQGEAGAPVELSLQRGPAVDRVKGVRRPVEQVETGGVARRPIVERGAPPIHLAGRDLRGIIDEHGKELRFV